ncbi:MAG: PspA/IM30 family protein [Chloroflexota bacterium]|nr:PspA/IM30 family protein [Chloroflexota bacterium]
MSLWSRIALILRIDANAALDQMEDPRRVLNYALTEQEELLRTVKQGLVEVVTAKHQLERQAEALRGRMPDFDRQARKALEVGREDLARLALERKHAAAVQLEALERHLTEVAADERRLTSAEQGFAARIEEFRTRRRVVSARHSAAEAQVRVGEALSGVSGQLAELGLAVGRAEERTEQLQARAAAIAGLLACGVLTTPLGGDPIERELNRLTMAQAVDAELAVLRAETAPNEPSAPTAEPIKRPTDAAGTNDEES